MTLMPTNVLIQGRRVWMECPSAEEGQPTVEYVNYHGQANLGYHMEYKPNLPAREPVELEPKETSDVT